MDDETLAPMADALSATLAVIVLLICFFILAQVVAVSKQIEVMTIGEKDYTKIDLNLDFKGVRVVDGRLMFYKSFNPSEDAEILDEFVKDAKAGCPECKYFNIVSNYPLSVASPERARKRSLSNAIKMVPTILKNGLEYEFKLSNNGNFYYIELIGVRD